MEASNRRMDVAFVQANLNLGGAEMMRCWVLPELIKRGLRVGLILIEPPADDEGVRKRINALDSAGVEIAQLNRSSRIIAVSTCIAVARQLHTWKPITVQAGQFNNNFHARIGGLLAGARRIVTEEHGINTWKRPVHRWIDRVLAHASTRIIAVSNAVKRHLVADIGLDANMIQVIHNPIAAASASGDDRISNRQAWRARWNVPDHVRLIGTLGTLRPEKAQDVLLSAAERLNDEPDWRLVLIGDGPLREALQAQAARLELGEHVDFAGAIPQARDALPALDLFVFPSRNEALGIALIEALAEGLPAIGATAGGIPEIAEFCERLQLVPADNPMMLARAMQQWLHENPGPCRAPRPDASITDRFSLERYVDQILRVCAHHPQSAATKQ